jgi:hypothetical protein
MIKDEEFNPILKKSGLNKNKGKKYIESIWNNVSNEKIEKWRFDSRKESWEIEGSGEGGGINLAITFAPDGETIGAGVDFNDGYAQVFYEVGASEWKKSPSRALKKTLEGLKKKFERKMDKINKEISRTEENTDIGKLVKELELYI